MASHFDSFLHNDPGFGITIPVECTNTSYVPDIWYQMEE